MTKYKGKIRGTKIINLLYFSFIIFSVLRLFIFRSLSPPITFYNYPLQWFVISQNKEHDYLWHVIHWFNFIPLKNIIHWITSMAIGELKQRIFIYNMIYPIIFSFFCGFFAVAKFEQQKWLKSMLWFILILCFILLARLFLTVGHFDIDKVILCVAGYSLGFFTTHKLISMIKLWEKRHKTSLN